MSLVKIRTPSLGNNILASSFSNTFQSQIEVPANATVELVNFACELNSVPYVNLDTSIATTVSVYDYNTAILIGPSQNVAVTAKMTRTAFLQAIEDALNLINPNVLWDVSVNVGIVNDTVRITWSSVDGITLYDLQFIMNVNYNILGMPTTAVRDDVLGNALAGIMSLPNPIVTDLVFPRNLSIELLDFNTESHDGVTGQKESIVFFIPGVDYELNNSSSYPLIKYVPSNTIRIKLNNETALKLTSLTVRVMTDEENAGIISKVYAPVVVFCAMTLSFKRRGEI